MTDWVMVGLTAIYVAATILICYFNYRSAKASKEQTAELKRQYDAENRPYVTTELIFERKVFYGLRFTNHGKRLAKHVKISFEESSLDGITEPNFKTLLEKENGRECLVGIGQHRDLFFGTDKFLNNPSKIPLSGCITYSDETTTYSDVFYIDFDTYATFFSVNSDKDDFLNQMKSQTKELKNIGKRLEQISIDSQERKAK